MKKQDLPKLSEFISENFSKEEADEIKKSAEEEFDEVLALQGSLEIRLSDKAISNMKKTGRAGT